MSMTYNHSCLFCEQKAGDFVFAVEVWRAGELLRRYLTADTHGAVYPSATSTFGCLAWSPDNGQLLYAAEAKLRGGTTWWDFAGKQKGKESDLGEWKLTDDAPVPGFKVLRWSFFLSVFLLHLNLVVVVVVVAEPGPRQLGRRAQHHC
jgi:hypothetical protein